VYKSRRIGWPHIIAAALGAVLVMLAFWQEFDPRVTVIFVIFLAVAEAFVQLRWRLSVPCKQCGFDPVLYKKRPEVAAEKVKVHLQRRREDPRYLLATPLNLPVRKVSADDFTPQSAEKALESGRENDRRGRLVSRQI
jgi:hypothetical protein